MRTSIKHIGLAALALVLAACGNVSRDIAKNGASAGELAWPAPGDTTPMHEGGTFPNLSSLRQVRTGLNKGQVSDLIGYPHFSEGVWGVREWNYLFNFRTPGSDQVTVCQYKVLFDRHRIARSFYWKPASCAALLEEPKPASGRSAVADRRVLSADALFAFGRADLSAAGRRMLEGLATELKGQGDRLRSVRIAGHTDRLGGPAYNRSLSERRAETVRRYLVAQGVPADRITTVGLGETDAVKFCSERRRAQLIACLEPNRRVEVHIDSGS